jgi:uncharacterized protein YggE
MKKFISVIAVLLAFNPIFVSGQAAGNYYYNQEVSKKGYSSLNNNADYDMTGNANYRNNYQQVQQYYPTITGSDTSFVLESKVMMNVQADEYVIILGTMQVGETVESCHELINKRISAFTTVVAGLGIKKEDIYIDFISQFPIFEVEIEKKLFSTSYNEIPKGFEVKKNIHLRYKDPKIVEKLLVEAAKNEIYDIIKVDYIINDMASINDSLRNSCINIISKKAKEFKKLGVKFDTNNYLTISDNISSTYPIEHYSTFMEFDRKMGGNNNQGKISARGDVPSLYYNKQSYNSYDLVINPSVVEPVIQFTCNVKVKYVLKKQ